MTHLSDIDNETHYNNNNANYANDSDNVVIFPREEPDNNVSHRVEINALCDLSHPGFTEHEKAFSVLTPDCFVTNPVYTQLFHAMRELHRRGTRPDFLALQQYLVDETKTITAQNNPLWADTLAALGRGFTLQPDQLHWVVEAKRYALRRQLELAYTQRRPASELLSIEHELYRLENPNVLTFGKRGIELMSEVMPEIEWVIEGLIPTHSRTSLVAKPKKGKTWLALECALAVAAGGYALGSEQFKCKQGDVLYLALEDGKRRLRLKLDKILSESQMTMPESFYYEVECPPVDKGGLAYITSWIKRVSNPVLIVVDTLKKFRPSEIPKGKSLYDVDYESTQALVSWVEKYGVSILFIHHANKRAPNDPQDLISGSFGLSGGLDNNLVMVREHNSSTAELHRIGRDYDDDDSINIRFDKMTALWGTVDVAEVNRSQRQKILALLDDGYQTVKEIAEVLNIEKTTSISNLLYKMVKAGLVKKVGYGKYQLTEDGESAKCGVSDVSDVSGVTGVSDVSSHETGDLESYTGVSDVNGTRTYTGDRSGDRSGVSSGVSCKANNDGALPPMASEVTPLTPPFAPDGLSDNADNNLAAQQAAYRDSLRRIWRDSRVSNIQMTLTALEQLNGKAEITDGNVWHDISQYLTKTGEKGTKQALLNFVAVRLGLIGESDGDEWWNSLKDNAAHLLAYLRQNGGRVSYRDGVDGLSRDDAEHAVWDLETYGLARDYRYQFEVELMIN